MMNRKQTMAEPKDPRSPDVFRHYVQLLQDLNTLGMVGFAKMLDDTPPEEMTHLINIVMHLQAHVNRVMGK